jgi:3' terminal RNA ribose 2'-O-methyltransferase Hen1
MLLTVTLARPPATDLGYLLHKHPGRCQTFELSFGSAHVFYPEATDDRCTAALVLDVDPVGLVRGRGRNLHQYVNDRPYVCSSFLSVAIARVYGTALSGRCAQRPEVAAAALPLEATLSVLPCRAGEDLIRRVFEPLGYRLHVRHHPLDASFTDWGQSPYFTVTLSANVRLSDLLAHLYVLVPVLDRDKHYWVGPDEIDKLVARGAGWLEGHPERETIVYRYLKYRPALAREALARLVEDRDPDAEAAERDAEEDAVEEPMRLHEQRIGAVLAVLRQSGARRVVDLGCGEGRLLRELVKDPNFTQITGVDVSVRSLERASDRLHLDRMPPTQRERVRLLHGSLTYADERIAGYDAAACIEVIEHLDPGRLDAFERVVFAEARPGTVVVTTPNVEYNVRFDGLPAGHLRHRDHRFEWTRDEFASWSGRIADAHGYRTRFLPVGPEDPEVGPPTQMAVFER